MELIHIKESDFSYVLAKLNIHFNENITITGSHLAMTFSSDNFDLYLRSTPYPVQHLVISRISINPTRKGHGKYVLDLLTEFTKEKGFTHLAVENALTIDMTSFCRKFGFVKENEQHDIVDDNPDVFIGKWYKEI